MDGLKQSGLAASRVGRPIAGLLALLLAGPLLAAGCATYQERVYPYHKSIYTWLGASISEVKAAWGEPRAADKLGDGRQAYTWVVQTGSDLCPTILITDGKGKVVNFNPDGTSEGCAKVPPPAARRK